MKVPLLSFLCTLVLLSARANAAPVSITLAEDGRALIPVIVSEKASAENKAHAQTLAKMLTRITGAEFGVSTGDGRSGIVVGEPGDFSALQLEGAPKGGDPLRREEYLLRTHERGVWLMGASAMAVEDAVWDFLHRIGYRQFFPGKAWEYVPQTRKLAVALDAHEKPAYLSRRIWYGFGPWDYAKGPYAEWCARNRCGQGVELNTGHSYDGILSRNKAAFAAHPEYLGLVDGQRRSSKFCISNPALRQLVVDDALRQLEADPSKMSISVDPSDGGGWCECAECAKLGSVTDRALTLANAVAAAVSAKRPGTLVGMYAYNQHSPPPSIQAHPAVVISVATGFIKGGYTVDQLLDAWSQKATTLGIREYYSVNTWDRDLPGAARGGNLTYLRTTIPHFHEKHARFLSAESSDNWGPNGLGYYVAARLLWDVREAEHVDALVADFLQKCFGAGREPMAKYYALLDSAKKPPLSDDLLGRMYRLVEEARQLEPDPAAQARLDDLTLYTRYVELWLDYSIAKGPARQAAFEAMIRHVYRMRGTMMVHALALYRDVAARDKAVNIPTEAKFNVPEGKNPWKSSAPFAREELAALARDGIAKHPLMDFAPVSFSQELVPARHLPAVSGKPGTMGIYSRAPRVYYTWVEKPPARLALTATAGIIYTTSGPAHIDLYPIAEAEGKSVAHEDVPPDKAAHALELATQFAGLHRLEIVGGGTAQTTWSDGVPMTIESSFEHPGAFHGRWTLHFYVPRGTAIVGGFAEGEGILRDGSGKEVHKFGGKPGYFQVPVVATEAGKLWRFENCSGDKMLMTVPPYLARSAEELLLPREVVEKDGLR